jgi:hypothetical protein
MFRQVSASDEEDAQSDTSEWELRERRERQEERRAEDEGMGAGVEEPILFRMPACMASTSEE